MKNPNMQSRQQLLHAATGIGRQKHGLGKEGVSNVEL